MRRCGSDKRLLSAAMKLWRIRRGGGGIVFRYIDCTRREKSLRDVLDHRWQHSYTIRFIQRLTTRCKMRSQYNYKPFLANLYFFINLFKYSKISLFTFCLIVYSISPIPFFNVIFSIFISITRKISILIPVKG